MSDSIDYERTLLQLPQCCVFKIPTRTSAQGHRAADWPKDPSWNGKMKITSRGRICTVTLLDDKNQIFALCPNATDDGAVEKVTDSGRYFVLKIQNAQGRHAFVGIAFNERNDAFDFNVTLQDHKNELERQDKAAAGIVDEAAPHQDLSLKQGQKIKINLKKKTDSGNNSVNSSVNKSGGTTIQHFDVFGSPSGGNTANEKSAFSFDSFSSSDPFASSDNDGFGSFTSASDPFATSSSSSDPFASTQHPNPSKGSSNAALDDFGFPIISNVTTSIPQKPKATSNDLLDFNF